MAWRISKDSRGETVLYRAGSMSGARSFLMIRMKDEIVIAVMTNNRELDFIEHFGASVKDAVLGRTLDFSAKVAFGEQCEIDIENKTPYHIATISIPDIFSGPQQMNLVASIGKDGVVLRNLKVGKDILSIELTERKLLIYFRNEDGEWVKKEYEN